MSINIAVACIKGGVGKTSTALNLADQLQARGRKVLLVDCDSQGNATYTYGRNNDGAEALTLVEAFKHNSIEEPEKYIKHTEYGDIIASDPELINVDQYVKDRHYWVYMDRLLSCFKGEYDYIIIDCPPVDGTIVSNALYAAKWVIIPVKSEMYSYNSVESTWASVEVTKEDNPDLQILGILKNEYNPRLTQTKENDVQLEKKAKEKGTKVFDTTIRHCQKVPDANTLKMRLSQYAKGCTAEQDYSQLADEVIAEVEK